MSFFKAGTVQYCRCSKLLLIRAHSFFIPNICATPTSWLGLQVALVVKNMSANAKDRRDTGSIPGGGHQKLCLCFTLSMINYVLDSLIHAINTWKTMHCAQDPRHQTDSKLGHPQHETALKQAADHDYLLVFQTN